MTVNEVAPEAAQEVEPTSALPPEGFVWVTRGLPGRPVVTDLPVSIRFLSLLQDGDMEQIPVVDGLRADPVDPKVHRAR